MFKVTRSYKPRQFPLETDGVRKPILSKCIQNDDTSNSAIGVTLMAYPT